MIATRAPFKLLPAYNGSKLVPARYAGDRSVMIQQDTQDKSRSLAKKCLLHSASVQPVVIQIARRISRIWCA